MLTLVFFSYGRNRKTADEGGGRRESENFADVICKLSQKPRVYSIAECAPPRGGGGIIKLSRLNNSCIYFYLCTYTEFCLLNCYSSLIIDIKV